MENMTFKEAKELIAKKYSFDNWNEVDKDGLYKIYETLIGYDEMIEEAAELYAKSKVIEKHIDLTNINIELIERFKSKIEGVLCMENLERILRGALETIAQPNLNPIATDTGPEAKA